jgi:hypothetical protein
MRKSQPSKLVLRISVAAVAAVLLTALAVPAQAHPAGVPTHYVNGGCLTLDRYSGVYADPTWIEPWWNSGTLVLSGGGSYEFGEEYVYFRALITWRKADGQWATPVAGQWVRALNGFRGNFASYEHQQPDGRYVPAGYLAVEFPRSSFIRMGYSMRQVTYNSGPYYVGYEIWWAPFKNSQYAQPPLGSQGKSHSQWMGWVSCSR